VNGAEGEAAGVLTALCAENPIAKDLVRDTVSCNSFFELVCLPHTCRWVNLPEPCPSFGGLFPNSKSGGHLLSSEASTWSQKIRPVISDSSQTLGSRPRFGGLVIADKHAQ
jgi:hypothetical protein